ncbi:hypothetical protein BJX68DRAFT_160836 [Aspergillus pseudodeflectus]|uniref:Orotidine 5'-phosphate decarboxylase domain-containing protein n=1 Tax=Aspergillus pseudodeflectus TaxID=176178 RepID=A0ABR4L1V0_9EURO
MASASLESSALPGNRLIAYLQALTKSKKGLPYGLPVCVSPSHTVTNTDALIRLATLVGPYIAVLQVHADIIDDWSEDTIRQLSSLAKKYAFLVWESGRILNSTIGVIGRQEAESREVRNTLVDLIRKKYTKGVVKPASWANISTAWASGVAVNNQAADILIPTLKAAAREAVADAVQTIRTEITADSNPGRPSWTRGNSEDSIPEHPTPEYVVNDGNNLGLPPRKASTISLTQTITQHTEDSTEALNELESHEQNDIWDYSDAAPPAIDSDLPPAPLLARGLVLCLPSAGDSAFTPEYRKSSMAAAYANRDFVLGFLCGQPWQLASRHDNDFFDPDVLAQTMSSDEQQQPNSEDDETPPQCLALFSVISRKLNLIGDQQPNEQTTASELPDSFPDSLNPLASRLHSIVRQGLKSRETYASQQIGSETARANSTTKTNRRRPSLLHVPIVSLP